MLLFQTKLDTLESANAYKYLEVDKRRRGSGLLRGELIELNYADNKLGVGSRRFTQIKVTQIRR